MVHVAMEDRTRIMDEPLPSIAVELSNGQSFEYLLSQDQIVAGRALECDLILEDLGVSRKHARIFFLAGEWKIEDLQSSNGVLVNGQKVCSASLADGDEAVLGGAHLVFSIPDQGACLEEKTVVQQRRVGMSKSAKPSRRTRLPGTQSKIVRVVFLSMIGVGLFVVGISLLGRQEQPLLIEETPSSQLGRDAMEQPDVMPETVFQHPVVQPVDGQGSTRDAALATRHAEAAQVFFDSGRLPDAVNEWNQAIMLDPDNAVYRVKLEQAVEQVTTRAEEAYRRGVRNFQFLNYEEAVRDWNHVLHLVPDQAHPLHQNALRNIEQAKAQMQR